MATITLTVEGSAVGTLTVVTTLSSEMSDRLLAYLAAVHGTKQADGQTVPRTPEEMVQAYWDGIVAGTGSNVVRFEQEQAATNARAAVPAFEVQ